MADLRALAARSYGQVMVTPPLPMMTEHPAEDLAELYKDLVEELIHSRHRNLAPDIQQALRSLGEDVPIERNVKIPIPVLARNWVAPVAYLNKARNYVKPHGFPDDERRAIDAASSIGIVGHLLHKNKTIVGGEEVGQHLIVVANLADGPVFNRVQDVLGQFDTEVVSITKVDGLVHRIREHARRPRQLHN